MIVLTVVMVWILDWLKYPTKKVYSFMKNNIKRCAKEGIKEGEVFKLFKIRTTQVPAEEEGRNQIVATRLRLSAYVFDVIGCKYPDRTISSLPINIQQIKDKLRLNLSIKNPVYIDIQSDIWPSRSQTTYQQKSQRRVSS